MGYVITRIRSLNSGQMTILTKLINTFIVIQIIIKLVYF